MPEIPGRTTYPLVLPEGFSTEIRYQIGYTDLVGEKGEKYGSHHDTIFFILKGVDGAISFALNTGWYGKPRDDGSHARAPMAGFMGYNPRWAWESPEGGNISSHTTERRDDGDVESDSCDVLYNGHVGHCFGKVGYGVSKEAFQALADGGEQPMWDTLLGFYDEWVRLPRLDGSE
jgi:hypothetical protein